MCLTAGMESRTYLTAKRTAKDPKTDSSHQLYDLKQIVTRLEGGGLESIQSKLLTEVRCSTGTLFTDARLFKISRTFQRKAKD